MGQYSSGLLILAHTSHAVLMGVVPPLQLHMKANLVGWDYGLLERDHGQPSRQEQHYL